MIWDPILHTPTPGNLLIYIGDQEPSGYVKVCTYWDGYAAWYRMATGFDVIPTCTPNAYFEEWASDVVRADIDMIYKKEENDKNSID